MTSKIKIHISYETIKDGIFCKHLHYFYYCWTPGLPRFRNWNNIPLIYFRYILSVLCQHHRFVLIPYFWAHVYAKTSPQLYISHRHAHPHTHIHHHTYTLLLHYSRDVRIMHQKIANSACHFCEFCANSVRQFNPFLLWYNCLWHRCTIQSIAACWL